MKKALFYILVSYLLFFGRLILPNTIMNSGKDIMRYFYPARFHLYSNLKLGSFPFWTEKMFSGYPIYLDGEVGYLNIFNVILTYLFGPLGSFKALHFLTYLAGAVFFYKYLKSKDFTLAASLLCHFVYFFSFFSLYHQQHQAITFSYYLFPAFVWALDRYASSSKIKYLLFWALLFVNLFYFAAFQMLFIITTASALFLLVHKKFLVRNIQHYVLSGMLTVSLCLPFILGYAGLYNKSDRYEKGFTWLEGSFSPVLLANLASPFTYRYQDFYMGVLANREFTIQEVYIYMGVTAFILGVLGILFSTLPKKDSVYLLLLVGLFLVIGLAKNNPVLNKLDIPPFSLFRYWGRLSFMAIFSLTVFAGHFFSGLFRKEPQDLRINRLNARISILFCAYLIFLFLWGLRNTDFIRTIDVFKRDDYQLDYWYIYLPMLLLGLAVFLMAFIKRGAYLHKIRRLVLIFVLLDSVIFGLLVLEGRFVDSEYLYQEEPLNNQNFKNTRIVVTDGDVRGNTFLYHSFWSPFGLSPIVNTDYTTEFKKAGFNSLSQVESKDHIEARVVEKHFIDGVDALGIKAVVNSQGLILYQNPNKAMFYLPDSSQENKVETVLQTEMKYEVKITTDRQSDVLSYIKYDPSWKLSVNGVHGRIENAGLFLKFNVQAGQNIIKIQYIPTVFYRNLLLALILTAISLTAIFYMERKEAKNE